jgi:hypothetical protein
MAAAFDLETIPTVPLGIGLLVVAIVLAVLSRMYWNTTPEEAENARGFWPWQRNIASFRATAASFALTSIAAAIAGVLTLCGLHVLTLGH